MFIAWTTRVPEKKLPKNVKKKNIPKEVKNKKSKANTKKKSKENTKKAPKLFKIYYWSIRN